MLSPWNGFQVVKSRLLNYKSIEDNIRALDIGGRLVKVVPLIPGGHARVLFAERNLYDEIEDGASATDATQFRIGQLRRDLDRFSAGGNVTVGYGKEKSCFLKLLDPRDEQVWEIRSRDPKPSIRVFGRFACRNVFIATHKAFRRTLADERIEWAREIRTCKAIWRGIFPTFDPHSGDSIDAYLSDVIEVGRLP